MNSISSPTFLRKRKFYTVLPALICPGLVIFFCALGGGSSAAAAAPTRTAGGLNLTLPGAKLKDDSHLTKMDYYRKADQDSVKRHVLAKNDPFYHLPGLTKPADANGLDQAQIKAPSAANLPGYRGATIGRAGDSDRNEALVYRKLALLNATLSVKAPATPPASVPTVGIPSSPDVGRLENLVQSLHGRDTTEDPELRQLSGLLDKLSALQKPDSRAVSADPASKGEPPVSMTDPAVAPVLPGTLMSPATPALTSSTSSDSDVNGFYPAEEMAAPTRAGVIPAVVDQTITVIKGSTVALRLQASIRVKGLLIPAGALAYGSVELSGDRVTMMIRSLQYQQQLFTVALTVFGLDGLPGIAAPASVTRDVAKQSADASVQSVGLTSFDQSIGAQAATVGIQAAKTMLSRKVRLITVTLPAGYQVLLKDNAQH
jgi:hypothetical protein